MKLMIDYILEKDKKLKYGITKPIQNKTQREKNLSQQAKKIRHAIMCFPEYTTNKDTVRKWIEKDVILT